MQSSRFATATAVLFAASSWLPCAVHAEAPAGTALELPDAIDRAVHHNVDLAVAVSRLEEAKASRAKTTTAFLPQIQAVGTYTHNSTEAEFSSSGVFYGVAKNFGIPMLPGAVLPPPSLIQRMDTVGGALTVDETVFALAPVLLAKAGERNIASATAGLEATRREITYQVNQLYYNTAGVGRLIQAAERAIALAEQRVRVAQERQSQGAEGELTVLRAQVERDRSEGDLVRAQAARQQLLVALGTILGEAPPAALAAPPELQVPTGQDEELLGEALRERPDLTARRHAVSSVQAQVTEAEFRWMPLLTVNGTGRYTDTPGFVGKNWLWSASANLVVPLFDRGVRYADARERRATLQRLRAELDKAETDIRAGLRQAHLDIDTARKTLAIALAQAQRARRTSEIVARAMQAGGATSLEVAEADTSLRLAEVQVERERINLDLGILKLRHLTGAIRAP